MFKKDTSFSARRLSAVFLSLGLSLSACSTLHPPHIEPAPQPAPPSAEKNKPVAPSNNNKQPENAKQAGIRPQNFSVSWVGMTNEKAASALAAFQQSCPFLISHTDKSGLTEKEDWSTPCSAAQAMTGNNSSGQAIAFFDRYFEPVVVGDGKAFVTGYYEPQILASSQPKTNYNTPIYRRPADLIEVHLGDFQSTLKGRSVRGRVEKGQLVPYFDRAAIDKGALSNRHLEIAWAADPVALFFLQIQGSGRLALEDGRVIPVEYDGQNGHDYKAIGRLLVQKGALENSQATMSGITDWLHSHPTEAVGIMENNPSYVFFRERGDRNPLGAIGIPVIAETSLAVDPAYIPLGAPVVLMLDTKHGGDSPFVNGVWIAQDKGGAIKGLNRFDSYWGYGAKAEHIAGGLASHGSAWLLLPKGVAARIGSEKHDKAQEGTKISGSTGSDKK
ncbi:MAG: murein transglycosylase A [Zymomonas mobilis subsp. pomaceae]|uniref:murein transglycosylase A n=1 Tax=Zymomonas mobilis TaxID=542 RepID=UPI000304FC13|nr:murein transglycosylase A [Zymomonas mobilis]